MALILTCPITSVSGQETEKNQPNQPKPCVSKPSMFWVCKGDVAFATGYLVQPGYVLRCKTCGESLNDSTKDVKALHASVRLLNEDRTRLLSEVDALNAELLGERQKPRHSQSDLIVWGMGGVLVGIVSATALAFALR